MTNRRSMMPLQYNFDEGGESRSNGPETADEFWARTTGKGKDSWGNQIVFDDHTQIANFIGGLVEPARQDFFGRIKNALAVSGGMYMGALESIPMFAKRLYETGSMDAPEVQEAVKQAAEETVNPPQQEMQTGGEAEYRVDPYRLLNSEYVYENRKNLGAETPKLDAAAKFFLPVTEDNQLDVGEAMMSMTPLGYFKKLDKLYDLQKLAQRELQVGRQMRNASGEVNAATRKLNKIDSELSQFSPDQVGKYKQYKASLNPPASSPEKNAEFIKMLRETASGSNKAQLGVSAGEKANIAGASKGLGALIDVMNKPR